MSATTDFILKLEDAELAADKASYSLSSELVQLSNLIWRAGKIEGPSLDVPLAETDQDWIDAMRGQLIESLQTLEEIQAANDSLRSLV